MSSFAAGARAAASRHRPKGLHKFIYPTPDLALAAQYVASRTEDPVTVTATV